MIFNRLIGWLSSAAVTSIFVRRKRVKVALWLCGLLTVLTIFAVNFHISGFSVPAQRRWIRKAVQELSQMPPPALESKPGTNNSLNKWWGHPNYLIFSNGWAAHTIRTIHSGGMGGDFAVLRASDGAFYYSPKHYCVGISECMEPLPEKHSPAPSDLRDYLQSYGRYQGWNLFAPAPNNQLWCVVNSEVLGNSSTLPVWVWISTGEGTNRTTLLDQRYEITGSDIFWNTHWFSNDCVAIDFYDYGPDPYHSHQ